MVAGEFFGPGTWLIFGVILVPVYTVFIAWFAGEPRDTNVAMMGVAYFFSFVVSLWAGLFALSMVIYFFFYLLPDIIG